MTKAYIVTEGATDAAYIKSLLPDFVSDPDGIRLVTGMGYSSALSIAQSVPVKTDKPALLIVDADTNDPLRIKEKQEFVEHYVHTMNQTQVSVLVAVPSMEVIFFADKATLETVLNKSISDEVWELAKFSPYQALKLLTGKDKSQFIDLLANQTLRQQIQKTPLVQAIKNFVTATA